MTGCRKQDFIGSGVNQSSIWGPSKNFPGQSEDDLIVFTLTLNILSMPLACMVVTMLDIWRYLEILEYLGSDIWDIWGQSKNSQHA
ncbi:MAG: hypothetical protein COB22_08280 [Cycloclasticus sp.]|nr:MAG: hypothetical protein COB22_08280 [Cycloclasticus sp.]